MVKLEPTTLLTVNELSAVLRVGRSAAYELCKTPGFPVIRIGRSIRVPKPALDSWLEAQLNVTNV